MLKLHYPMGVQGTKYVLRDDTTGEHVLISYSSRDMRPEILMFSCDGLGNVRSWEELYGEVGDLTPRDIFKVMHRYNEGARAGWPPRMGHPNDL